MSANLEIGVQLPEVEREVGWPEIREMAHVAEEVGLDSIWVGDHLLFRDQETGTRGPWEAWTMLAGLAEATERVAIGPLVAATSFHNPAMIAKKAATVDEISGGRLVLGLGAGWNRAEYEAFGFPYDHRVDRFEEAFTVIRTLIRTGSIDFEGDYFTLRDMELLPAARPGMRIMIGSNGPRMLRIAAPHVDMWNTWYTGYGNTPSGLDPLLAGLDEAARAAGRDPSAIERTAAVLVQMAGGKGRVSGSAERPEVEPISGSRSEVAEAIGSLAAMGITHFQVVLDPIDARSIEALGEIAGLIH